MLLSDKQPQALSAFIWCPAKRRRGSRYAWACWRRLHASVPSSMLAVACLDIARGGSPTRRPTWLMEFPHHAFKGGAAACGGDVFAEHREPGSCPHQGACRSSRYAEKPSPPYLFAGRSACTSLSCRESWRGTPSLGPIGRNRPAQTISPALCAFLARQILCASRPSTLLRPLARCGPPTPRRLDHNKDALARP